MISDILSKALDDIAEYDGSPMYDGACRTLIDDLTHQMRFVLHSLDAPPEQNAKVKTSPEK